MASTENIDVVSDRVNAGTLTAEFVLSGALADSLRRRQDDAVTSLLDSGTVLWRTASTFPSASSSSVVRRAGRVSSSETGIS
jgi:hypothetical protein